MLFLTFLMLMFSKNQIKNNSKEAFLESIFFDKKPAFIVADSVGTDLEVKNSLEVFVNTNILKKIFPFNDAWISEIGEYIQTTSDGLSAYSPFAWIHLCVSVIPILLWIVCIWFSISVSQKVEAQKLSLGLRTRALSQYKFSLTIKSLQYFMRLFVVLFVLEIINIVNWNKQIVLFGGLFISNGFTSFLVCCLLVLSWIGFTLCLHDLQAKKRHAIRFILVLPFVIFFLFVMVYSYNILPFFMGLEGTTFALITSLALMPKKARISKNIVLFKRDSFLKGRPQINTTTISSLVLVTGVSRRTQKKIVHVADKQRLHQPLIKTILLSPATKFSKLESFLSMTKGNQHASVFAALIYFLLNIVVTLCFGFAIFWCLVLFNATSYQILSTSLIYYQTGVMDFNLGILIFFLLIAFGFKLGVVPFHFWLPAVFSGSNIVMLFFFSLPVKFVLLVSLHKFLYGIFYHFFFFWGPILIFLGLASICIGSLGLFIQKDIKKFLAYSTINHFGYMFLALSCGNLAGQQAFFVYMITYFITNIAFLYFIVVLKNPKTNQSITSLADLNNVCFISRLSQFGFAVVLLSMLGLPPLLGFWGKYYVISALVAANTLLGYLLILCVIVTSVIAASSYLSVLKNLFIFSKKNNELSSFSVFFNPLLRIFYSLVVILLLGWVFFFFSFWSIFLDFLVYGNIYPAFINSSTLMNSQLERVVNESLYVNNLIKLKDLALGALNDYVTFVRVLPGITDYSSHFFFVTRAVIDLDTFSFIAFPLDVVSHFGHSVSLNQNQILWADFLMKYPLLTHIDSDGNSMYLVFLPELFSMKIQTFLEVKDFSGLNAYIQRIVELFKEEKLLNSDITFKGFLNKFFI